ncbi:hypothetical protein A2W24_04635 [Microgenomates group bacterium RBG_16_45_19]|nr:MAG: hypothetical protein A2W24_04635 [Microgenomates group bacterium RBG_16_45_19]
MYRINELIKLDQRLYHTNDLALVWQISNRNTLYTTIKRYVQKGILIPIYKGLYATVDLKTLDPIELGVKVIHDYTYLSTETVLAEAGVIFQKVFPYTFVAAKSKKVTVGAYQYVYRQLEDKFLHNRLGVLNQSGYFRATPERAVADLLYFNPKYYLDNRDSLNGDLVDKIQRELGYL